MVARHLHRGLSSDRLHCWEFLRVDRTFSTLDAVLDVD